MGECSIRSSPKSSVSDGRERGSDCASERSRLSDGRLVASIRPSPKGVAVPVTTSPLRQRTTAPPPPPRLRRSEPSPPAPRAAPPPPARHTHVTEEVSSRKAKRRTRRASPPRPQ